VAAGVAAKRSGKSVVDLRAQSGDLFAGRRLVVRRAADVQGHHRLRSDLLDLFDLSIPEWSLLFFISMMTLGIYQLLRQAWVALRRPLSGESSHRALVGD
jgi:hypothetical protein